MSGMTIREDKCVFNSGKILHLVYPILKDEISTDPSLTQKILVVSPPTNKNELESLSLTNFYSNQIFIIEASAKLRKTNKEFRWTNIHQRAFDNLKMLMQKSRYQYFCTPPQVVTLTTDASQNSISQF